MSKTIKISVYGVGNFGYAILKHLDTKGGQYLRIKAYDRKQVLIESLSKNRKHLYFHQDVEISQRVNFVTSGTELVTDSDVIVLAVSSDATREVIRNIKDSMRDNVIILNTAKALDLQTGKRLSEVVAEELEGYKYTYACLAGGTIANDLFKHEPLGVDIASNNTDALSLLMSIFKSDNLSTYGTKDVLGAEYAGAFKNLVAILAGIVKGLGFSYGAETHLISRVSYEIGAVCISRYGASEETFSIGSQCWGNDLWMSCTGGTRNREFGIMLGEGLPVDTAISRMKAMNKTIEGVNTLAILENLPDIRSIEIVDLLYKLVVDKTIDIKYFQKHIL